MDRNYHIRPAAKSDLATVLEIDARGFGPGRGYNRLVLRQIYDAAPDYFLVAERDGKIVGYIAALPSINPQIVWVVVLVVDLPERGSGVAWDLYRKLVAVFKAKGVKEAFLTVRAKMAGVYARFGYRVVGEEQDYFGPGEHRLVMKADL